ncbi:hypothetical protein DFH28DRAFT_938162 [Melampsora americana]|nr:hypothetical protein DFH28DRAFT_938162 [Melampsora americana]
MLITHNTLNKNIKALLRQSSFDLHTKILKNIKCSKKLQIKNIINYNISDSALTSLHILLARFKPPNRTPRIGNQKKSHIATTTNISRLFYITFDKKIQAIVTLNRSKTTNNYKKKSYKVKRLNRTTNNQLKYKTISYLCNSESQHYKEYNLEVTQKQEIHKKSEESKLTQHTINSFPNSTTRTNPTTTSPPEVHPQGNLTNPLENFEEAYGNQQAPIEIDSTPTTPAESNHNEIEVISISSDSEATTRGTRTTKSAEPNREKIYTAADFESK